MFNCFRKTIGGKILDLDSLQIQLKIHLFCVWKSVCALIYVRIFIWKFSKSGFGILKFQRERSICMDYYLLTWLYTETHRWKTVLANHISKIQKGLPNNSWNGVCVLENTCDCGDQVRVHVTIGIIELWSNTFTSPEKLKKPWNETSKVLF